MKRLFSIVAGASALALTLSGCANYSEPTSAAPANGDTPSATAPKLIADGKLTVCTHLSYPPFQFKDGDTIVGFDVDLMDTVAKKLGVTQEIVDIDFGQITSGAVFAAGTCDAGAAAITITEERQAAAPFSDPYFDATQALLVKSDSGITDLSSLSGKILAVQADTTGKIYAEENAEANGYEIKIFDDMPTGANAVIAGTADAAINDNGVMFDFAKANAGTEVVKEFPTGEQYGFNVSQDNPGLLSAINEALTAAKADGTYNDIYKKWFGVDAPK